MESLFPKIKSEKAQDWLNRKYSNKEAVKEIEMNIAKEQIEGELKIAEFPQLEKIEVTNGYLTKLLIINCPQLIKLDCSNSLLSEQSHLKITGCPKLEKLICAGNFISHLDVREVGNLKELNCSDNNLHFSSLNDILNRAD